MKTSKFWLRADFIQIRAAGVFLFHLTIARSLTAMIELFGFIFHWRSPFRRFGPIEIARWRIKLLRMHFSWSDWFSIPCYPRLLLPPSPDRLTVTVMKLLKAEITIFSVMNSRSSQFWLWWIWKFPFAVLTINPTSLKIAQRSMSHSIGAKWKWIDSQLKRDVLFIQWQMIENRRSFRKCYKFYLPFVSS